MKKLVLSVSFIFALGVNIFGQIQEDEKNRPISSNHYAFQNNDSIQDNETFYTYNSNKQLIKKVVYTFLELYDSVDSTLISYDTNNRIISSYTFTNDILSSSETWNYDEQGKQIDYFYSVTSLDSLGHIIYMGVNDFDKLSIYSLTGSLLDEIAESSIIDCDSIYIMS
jgi:hypothetical protein